MQSGFFCNRKMPGASQQVEPAIGFGSRSFRNRQMITMRAGSVASVPFSDIRTDRRSGSNDLSRNNSIAPRIRQTLNDLHHFKRQLLRPIPHHEISIRVIICHSTVFLAMPVRKPCPSVILTIGSGSRKQACNASTPDRFSELAQTCHWQIRCLIPASTTTVHEQVLHGLHRRSLAMSKSVPLKLAAQRDFSVSSDFPVPASGFPVPGSYSSSHKGRTWWTRLNTPGNGAPDAMTEINFGLPSAGSRRLARHGRHRQGSTYLRTAIVLSSWFLVLSS